MMKQIIDICLINSDRCQSFIDSYASWIEKSDDTDGTAKKKDLKFDAMKFIYIL